MKNSIVKSVIFNGYTPHKILRSIVSKFYRYYIPDYYKYSIWNFELLFINRRKKQQEVEIRIFNKLKYSIKIKIVYEFKTYISDVVFDIKFYGNKNKFIYFPSGKKNSIIISGLKKGKFSLLRNGKDYFIRKIQYIFE